MQYPSCSSPKQCSTFNCAYISPETNRRQTRGAVIETRCKQNEYRGENVKKQRQGQGVKQRKSGCNEQQITFRVTQFIFQMLSKVGGKEGRGRERQGTWRGSGGDGLK